MRRAYIDNLRCGIIILVIIYHVFYLFNSLGIISNVAITGMPQMDLVEYALYPWFMACLFLIAGVSARHGLEAKGVRAFMRGRVRKILIPSIAGIFLIGWIGGWVTAQYADMFAGNGDLIPGVVKYFVYCFAGIGPFWFLHELFFCTLVLLLVRRLDRKDRLWTLGGRADKLWVLCLLFFAVWGSSLIGNMPLIEVYRNGFYLLFFLLGYYVFSHDEVQAVLERFWLPLLSAAVLIGGVYVVRFWGESYASMENLKNAVTNAYAWFMTLALLGTAGRWWNRETGFTRFMRGRSFAYYVLHMPLMIIITYVMDKNFEIKFPLFYFILAALEAVLLPVCCRVLCRLPVVKRLLFGL